MTLTYPGKNKRETREKGTEKGEMMLNMLVRPRQQFQHVLFVNALIGSGSVIFTRK